MSFDGKTMVKIRFEGRNLADCDFWTKSDPYLLIKRPPRAGSGFIDVSFFKFAGQTLQLIDNAVYHLYSQQP